MTATTAHTAKPLGVHCQMPRSRNSVPTGSAAFLMRRASRNSWHVAFALSRPIKKVVVVVVVTMRRGFLGSGVRFDCANLSADRLRHASSLRRVHRDFSVNLCCSKAKIRTARRE